MDHWFIRWQGSGGAESAEIAASAEEAVEIIRRFLACDPATDSSEETVSPFDLLFQGAPPVVLLRHVRHSVEHKTENGLLVIKRGR